MGGISTLALRQFLKNHPEVTHCLVCTDDDEAGTLSVAAIKEIAGVQAEPFLPVFGNDWNDTLMEAQRAQRVGNRKKSTERS